MTPLEKFTEYLKSKNATEDTIKRYGETVKHFCSVYGEDSKKFDTSTVTSYLAKLQSNGGHGSYLRYSFYCLKTFYRCLGIAWPFEKEDVPKLDEPKQRWYAMNDIKMLIEAAKRGGSVRDWLIFFILGLTGRRRKAFAMLKRTDYDPETGVLTMPSVKRGKISPIRLPKEVNKAMVDYLLKRDDQHSALFPSLRSRKSSGEFAPHSLNMLLIKYCKATGLPNKGMHAFRRGLITYYRNVKKLNNKEIVRIMDDWSSETSGMIMVDRYAQLDDDYGPRAREENNPLWQEEDEPPTRPSKLQRVVEGREESPQERFKRLRGKPMVKEN